MRKYILKRLLLIPLTLWGIITVNFAIVQLAPGGPVDYVLAQYRGMNTDAKSQITGTADMQQSSSANESSSSKYVGAQGVPDDLIKALEQQFGFDKPWYYRYGKMIKDYLCFDFGKSYYRDKSITDLIKERLPVSVSLGLWSTLIIYLIAIPLGISKARRDGSKFDITTSFMIVIGSAMPVFLVAVFFIVPAEFIFSGFRYVDWFPITGNH